MKLMFCQIEMKKNNLCQIRRLVVGKTSCVHRLVEFHKNIFLFPLLIFSKTIDPLLHPIFCFLHAGKTGSILIENFQNVFIIFAYKNVRLMSLCKICKRFLQNRRKCLFFIRELPFDPEWHINRTGGQFKVPFPKKGHRKETKN